MRTLGAVLLGLIGGLVAGFFLEVLIGLMGELLLDDPDRPAAVALLPPLCAIAGAIAGPIIDRRRDEPTRRR
ncbi:DUF5957 family protein [Spirillospora sp. NPDC047279]|uniref:DUF5957 family protein n=1 Tax=Spirillospora sp. NPDC047279 TaxID=3155478 RepID=UPI00340981FC